MATITAATPSSDRIQTSPPRETPQSDPPRRVWQVPVFLLGVSACVVCWLRPFGSTPTGRQIDRDMAAARQILARPDGDPSTAAEHARRAVELAEKAADRKGEANFLLGSAEIRLAEKAVALEATEWWKLARQHLEEAERLGVIEQERSRLQYRLAKTWSHTGEDPQLVVDRLASVVDSADDRVEAYRLLTEAYLRLPEPNLKAALAANEKLRSVPLIGPEVQAPAQLQAGELHIRLGQAEEARKVLVKIGTQAPAGILSQARMLRAQSFQAENRYIEAAEEWKKLFNDPREPLANRGIVLYHLGVCESRQPGETQQEAARRLWGEVLDTGKGEEVAAAALALSEVWLQGPNPEKALDALTRAVHGVSTATDWKNTLVDLDKVRERFEQTQQAYRKAGRYDLALKVVELYQNLALPNRAALLRGEVGAEWGRYRLKAAQELVPSEGRKTQEEQARAKLREAGTAYLHVAALAPADEENNIWLAARCLIDAHDDAEAIKVLNRYLDIGKKERKGEAWYRLAECQARQSDPVTRALADQSYKHCLEHESPFRPRARYELALRMIERKELDTAQEELRRNVTMLRAFETDEETAEKCRFVLGRLAYERRDFSEAEKWLSQSLKAGEAPTHAEATRARLQLAESYRQIALDYNQKAIDPALSINQRTHASEQYRRYLKCAADEYSTLTGFLDTPASIGQLSLEERVRVPFVQAECRFNLGDYKEALDTYIRLAERFSAQPMRDSLAARYPELRLEALGGVVRCYAAIGNREEMRKRLDEIQASLPFVDESLRRKWEDWLRLARQPLTMP